MAQNDFDIESLPVVIKYIGQTKKDEWDCDQWRIELKNNAGYWSTDYFTGLGLRKKSSFGSSTPKKPKIADVLYTLFMDARAADLNFDDWCDEFGFSSDSIKALNTYKQCLGISHAIKKHFSKEQRDAIQSVIENM